MKFKKTGAEKTTITRDLNKFIEKTDNIFKAVSITYEIKGLPLNNLIFLFLTLLLAQFPFFF